jgi:ubiquinone/menaquinone biosynthesis C-methylase UbiE
VTSTNAWSNPSRMGAQEAQRMAAFLEQRSRFPDQIEVNQALLSALNLQPGERVLEAGCGSGALARMAAGNLKAEISLVGLDISPDFLDYARRLDSQEDRVAYVAGDVQRLPVVSGCFDVAIAARLLLHVDDPLPVVCELARALRPGGRMALMDWDFETLAVDHPERELTRRLLHWRNDHHGGNNWSGRQLLRLAIQAGLHNPQVFPVTSVARDQEANLTHSLQRAADVARQAGAISGEEHTRWVGLIQERLEQGTFFASMAYFIVIATQGVR